MKSEDRAVPSARITVPRAACGYSDESDADDDEDPKIRFRRSAKSSESEKDRHRSAGEEQARDFPAECSSSLGHFLTLRPRNVRKKRSFQYRRACADKSRYREHPTRIRFVRKTFRLRVSQKSRSTLDSTSESAFNFGPGLSFCCFGVGWVVIHRRPVRSADGGLPVLFLCAVKYSARV